MYLELTIRTRINILFCIVCSSRVRRSHMRSRQLAILSASLEAIKST